MLIFVIDAFFEEFVDLLEVGEGIHVGYFVLFGVVVLLAVV